MAYLRSGSDNLTEHQRTAKKHLEAFRAAADRSRLTTREIAQLLDMPSGTVGSWRSPGYRSYPQSKYWARMKEFAESFPKTVELPVHAQAKHIVPPKDQMARHFVRAQDPPRAAIRKVEEYEYDFHPDLLRGLVLGLLMGFLIGGGLAMAVCRMGGL